MNEVPIAIWCNRLHEKIGCFQSIDEAVSARLLYDQGISVHLAQKAMEESRKWQMN